MRASDPVARFWAKVDKSGGPDACWLWTGPVTTDGYGIAALGGERGAHRIALALSRTVPIPPRHYACHRCDRPGCCNPAHLFAGTASDNRRDAARKQRLPQQTGAREVRPSIVVSGGAKLDAWLRASGVTQTEFARCIGVGQQTVAKYLTCVVRPTAYTTALAIQRETGIPPEDWFTDEELAAAGLRRP